MGQLSGKRFARIQRAASSKAQGEKCHPQAAEIQQLPHCTPRKLAVTQHFLDFSTGLWHSVRPCGPHARTTLWMRGKKRGLEISLKPQVARQATELRLSPGTG